MENVKLNNNLECPVIGIGTFMLSPSDAENSVREALKMGYRLIDTANAYVNERAVGRGMKASGVKREETFLSTKLWPSEYENPNAVDETLERLGVDYKMKLEAIKHQGTSSQFETKLRSDEQVAKDSGDSRVTVQRLIRLTYLTPELQEYVDDGRMKVSPAVEISFLDEERQRDIVDRMEETEIFPSHAQARRMRQLAAEGSLDYDAIKEIMSELKPNQVEKLKIPIDHIRPYLPKGATPKDIEELAIKLFRQNYERQARNRNDAR